MDYDGAYQYSKVVQVRISKNNPGFSVFPNPVINNTFKLQMNNMAKGDYTLRLINMAGQVMFTREINHQGGNTEEVIMPGKFISRGVYKLELTDTLNNASVINVKVD